MSENRCIVCNVDMGDCNPRQYCRKTYCENEEYIISTQEETKSVVINIEIVEHNAVEIPVTMVQPTEKFEEPVAKKRKL